MLVLITTYNRAEMLDVLLSQLMDYEKQMDLTIIVLNDGSSEDYTHVKNKYPSVFWLKNKVNNGKKYYWKTITKLYKFAKKFKEENVYLQLPDDITLVDNFFDKLFDLAFEVNNLTDCLNILTTDVHKRIYDVHCQTYLDKFYISNFFDLCGLFNRKFLEAVNYQCNEIPLSNWAANDLIGSGVGRTLSNQYALPIYQTKESLVHHSDHDSVMNYKARKEKPLVC